MRDDFSPAADGVPILNASGCLDALTAPDVARSLDAFVTKTVTPLRREGNPPPRIAETDEWMLNSIGLQNPGIDAWCADSLPALRVLEVALWVSVGGFSAHDYALMCERLDDVDAVDVIELNLSRPRARPSWSPPLDARRRGPCTRSSRPRRPTSRSPRGRSRKPERTASRS
jgi:dihydroorotate dehydrogenase